MRAPKVQNASLLFLILIQCVSIYAAPQLKKGKGVSALLAAERQNAYNEAVTAGDRRVEANHLREKLAKANMQAAAAEAEANRASAAFALVKKERLDASVLARSGVPGSAAALKIAEEKVEETRIYEQQVAASAYELKRLAQALADQYQDATQISAHANIEAHGAAVDSNRAHQSAFINANRIAAGYPPYFFGKK